MSAGSGVGFNFAILTGGQLLARLLSFAVMVHLGRALLAEGFGAIAFATGVLTNAALIVDLGFESLGPLEVARARYPLRVLVGNIVTLRLALSLLAFAAAATFATLAPMPAQARPVLVLYAVSLIANAVDLQWVFLGAARMTPAAAAEILQQALLAVGVFALVHGPRDLLMLPVLFGASRAAAVVALVLAFRNSFGGFRLGIDRAVVTPLLRASLPMAGSAFAGALLHNFDLILLGMLVGAEAAGLYGAAYRVLWVPTLVTAVYLVALRPSLTRAALAGRDALRSILKTNTGLAVAFGSGVAVGGPLLAEPLLEWLFGAAYAAAAPALRVLLASCLLFSVSRLYRLTVVACGRERRDLVVISAAAALNVALNGVLVPRAGLLGAAWATFAAEAFMLLAALSAARSVAGRLPTGGALGRTLLASAALALALYQGSSLHVLPRAMLGAAVYLVALLALRVVDLRALRWSEA